MQDFKSSCTEHNCTGIVAAQGTGAWVCHLLLGSPSAPLFLQLSGAEVACHFPGLSPH